jgi:hypothetical protein
MNKSWIAFALLLLLFGCKRTVEIEVPQLKGLPSGLVLKTRIISSEPSQYTVEVEVDLHIVDNRGVPIKNINEEGFSIDGKSQSNLNFGKVKVDKGFKTDVKGDYDVLFLMDQSGSITSTDRYDARIDAANFFLDNLGPGDRVGLASFQNSSFKSLNVIGRDVAGIRSSLEILRTSETGGTPLYFSTRELVKEFEKMSTSLNKALIVFTDGEDTYGSSTPEQIITLAKEKGVAVHTVGLRRDWAMWGRSQTSPTKRMAISCWPRTPSSLSATLAHSATCLRAAQRSTACASSSRPQAPLPAKPMS